MMMERAWKRLPSGRLASAYLADASALPMQTRVGRASKRASERATSGQLCAVAASDARRASLAAIAAAAAVAAAAAAAADATTLAAATSTTRAAGRARALRRRVATSGHGPARECVAKYALRASAYELAARVPLMSAARLIVMCWPAAETSTTQLGPRTGALPPVGRRWKCVCARASQRKLIKSIRSAHHLE